MAAGILTGFLIAVVLLLFCIILSVIVKLEEFRIELKYIKLEIKRASGNEKKHWVRKKRRLWLELFLFYR